LAGGSLIGPPRGFDPEDVFVKDLKRKDFIVMQTLTKKQMMPSDFLKLYLEHCNASRSLVNFLSKALG